MTARVLITGKNRSGSWQIRGEQLGAAIGAKVELRAVKASGYDVCVVVKRAPFETLRALRVARVPLVWDVVDAWPQPEGNSWGRSRSLEWLQRELEAMRPQAVVATTTRMSADVVECGFKGPVLVLPHHARPKQPINVIRPTVRLVGYEGSEVHLGERRAWVENECTPRGWLFSVTPSALADLDIVVAFRQKFGYATTHWKSNVKLANAQGSGTPCVLGYEAGYEETASGGECWASTSEQLKEAFDLLTPYEERKRRQALLLSAAPSLNGIAKRYTEWLDHLKS